MASTKQSKKQIIVEETVLEGHRQSDSNKATALEQHQRQHWPGATATRSKASASDRITAIKTKTPSSSKTTSQHSPTDAQNIVLLVC